MDALLARLGYQALNIAMRSGIVLTYSFATTQYCRLVAQVEDRQILSELKRLQKQLDSKIKIISPAIDLIELKSGRGNNSLESAVPVAKSLHRDINRLGAEMEEAAAAAEHLNATQNGSANSKVKRQLHAERLKRIVADVKSLLARVDSDIPALHMAITASGESLSSSLSPGVSPSRLLQASALLLLGDTGFAANPYFPVQIGPTFTLSLYMLFLGHADTGSRVVPTKERDSSIVGSGETSPFERPGPTSDFYGFQEGTRRPIWQEVIHKARVKMVRRPNIARDHKAAHRYGSSKTSGCSTRPAGAVTPTLHQYSYCLEVAEDFDDGRLHVDQEESCPASDHSSVGIRDTVPIHQICKIFYADTGRLLNIRDMAEWENRPVLLLKRDMNMRGRNQMRTGATAWDDDDSDDPDALYQVREGMSNDAEQKNIDQQLQEEIMAAQEEISSPNQTHEHGFPRHLDPEWIAFEVFEDPDSESTGDDEEDETDEDDIDASCQDPPVEEASETSETSEKASKPIETKVSSLNGEPAGEQEKIPNVIHSRPGQLASTSESPNDRSLINQTQNLHLNSSPINPTTSPSTYRRIIDPPDTPTNLKQEMPPDTTTPYGTIQTSLSLMEMLIRLAGLQEFQQTSHLSLPDHILAFHMEETSTTGMRGEQQRRARSDAKERVGFDPYTDGSHRGQVDE